MHELVPFWTCPGSRMDPWPWKTHPKHVAMAGMARGIGFRNMYGWGKLGFSSRLRVVWWFENEQGVSPMCVSWVVQLYAFGNVCLLHMCTTRLAKYI